MPQNPIATTLAQYVVVTQRFMNSSRFRSDQATDTMSTTIEELQNDPFYLR